MLTINVDSANVTRSKVSLPGLMLTTKLFTIYNAFSSAWISRSYGSCED